MATPHQRHLTVADLDDLQGRLDASEAERERLVGQVEILQDHAAGYRLVQASHLRVIREHEGTIRDLRAQLVARQAPATTLDEPELIPR